MGAYKNTGVIALLCLLSLCWAKVHAQQSQLIDENIIDLIDSANALSFQYLTTNTFEAEQVVLHNLHLSDSIGYKKGQLQSYKHLSLIYYYQGKYDLSAEMNFKTINLYEELGMFKEAAFQYSGYGYQVKRRSLDDAEFYIRKGIAISEAYHDTTALVDSYNWYGVVKEFREQLDSALYYYEKSFALKKILGDSLGFSYSLSNIAGIHYYRREYDEALNKFQKAYQISVDVKDSTAIATYLHNISYVYMAKEDWKEAIDYLKSSIDLSLDINYTDLTRSSYNYLSSVFESAGKPDSALYYYKLFVQLNDSLITESTQNRIAELEVQFKTEQKEKELALNRSELNEAQLKVKQRNLILIIMGCVFLFSAFIVYLIYRQQKTKQLNIQRENKLRVQLANVEMENRIHQERERISRDLHDNVGAQITNLITGLEISNLFIKKNQKDEALGLITDLDVNAREAMTELRETIWLLDKDAVVFTEFVRHLNEYVKKQQPYLGSLDIHISNDVPKDVLLNPRQSLHLLRIIQEALNNCRKYAHASNFYLDFSTIDSCLVLYCKDDGVGACLSEISEKGNGLNNIEKRIQELSGQLVMETAPNAGFSIHITIPILQLQVNSAVQSEV